MARPPFFFLLGLDLHKGTPWYGWSISNKSYRWFYRLIQISSLEDASFVRLLSARSTCDGKHASQLRSDLRKWKGSSWIKEKAFPYAVDSSFDDGNITGFATPLSSIEAKIASYPIFDFPFWCCICWIEKKDTICVFTIRCLLSLSSLAIVHLPLWVCFDCVCLWLSVYYGFLFVHFMGYVSC